MVIAKKRKRMCEGRLIVADFKKLNPADFEPLYHFNSKSELREEVFLQSIKGVIYINSRNGSADFLAKIFEFLMKATAKELKNYQREFRSRYPAVKSFEDWGEIAKKEGCGNKDSLQSLIKLLIPIERKRRKIEFDYFGQTRLSQNEDM